MGFLQGKKILITGMISERSIAYGIAKSCYEQGAELAFTYVVDKLEDRVRKMAAELGSELVYRCDVQSDEEINQLFADLGQSWSQLDGLVHAIAFAPKEALNGDFLDSMTREAFMTAHEVSAYSLPALAKAARPLMSGHNSSILALTYLGAVRAIPNYNVMGMAKASLEAGIRFTAACLGQEGIRCNGISAGPIRTLAASGIANFSRLLAHVSAQNPIRRNITIEEVGNTAAFLLSDMASGITGEITYVDGGYSINALGVPEDLVSTHNS
ncbi:enoyl-ACP reductase FabI [Snodgrassella alvi]|jgi:enoyl-[acyl-carrier protein] reductase I|uniref:Enoyl-[acyl-carrier-protein] reductase [NADH] n=1 Tax=Snodgrassella alvi TaxID=1196083 RepID=A0A855FTZ5_9NEIS|nr:enoyl-ACP reductase FabI [Snodgrassella alvi]PIT10019.1 enoyl-[acyl-carrier-protein] reductase [Snodgrassella alvi]PIT23803.1 enoyl-[acyl-carrier-protein] reductase [Snodgrassella alvi]PIT43160.1 enoyl-[acyl-carrier-protein] reductase [Snodgrassella alvi]PIT57316.1 enoyl-[acyl-carrier-protein] reductase [Snodgrassella alvi]PIT58550.1 enoyl-[acyl-carrier-protein] reductase [Snodgrassella alvi]